MNELKRQAIGRTIGGLQTELSKQEAMKASCLKKLERYNADIAVLKFQIYELRKALEDDFTDTTFADVRGVGI